MNKFWNFIRNDEGERILRLDGPIDEDNFWGDEITPAAFRDELETEEGDVTVWLNSPGGNVLAAAQIYNMLCDHKGKITVKIDAIAASAASVVAMAGDVVLISPVGMLLIHDPMTIAMGNAKDMEKAITTLNEVKESIINAYQKKTGMSRNKISRLMENETWMNAQKAVELGFADGIMFDKKGGEDTEKEGNDEKEIEASWHPYSTKAMGQRILNRLVSADDIPAVTGEESVTAENSSEGDEPVEEGMINSEHPAEDGISEISVIDERPPTQDETVIVQERPEPGTETSESYADTPAIEAETSEPDAETPVSKVDTSEPVPISDTDLESDTTPDPDPDPPNDIVPQIPIIGMDGKTSSGAMPYELLKKQLEFLK